MTEASAAIIEIVRREGPMTFADFQALALYHPEHGYYTAGPARSGWAGHYVTSPQLDAGFGTLWARALEQVWGACGTPSSFEVVEVGPGEGGFAASVLGAVKGGFAHALTYRLVERSDALRERQREVLSGHERVSWVSDLTDVSEIEAGCIVANEVLDNQPVHVVERRDGAILELFVEADGEGLKRTLGSPSDSEIEDFLRRNALELEEGGVTEVGTVAEDLALAAARLVRKGAVVFIDYGATSEELLRHPAGTVVCYSAM